jgi:hypothetical protein
MMVQEERFRSDSKILKELAEDAYDTCVSAIDALHALLREHNDDSDDEGVCDCGHEHEATVAEASDHDCGAAHEAPVKAPAEHPGLAYFRARGYPEGQLEIMKKYWAAYKMGKEAGRQAELEYGGWATLSNKKRIMVYKWHAFEPPSDRDYAVPGPLKHLGKYNRADKRINGLAPGEVVPVVPQTAEDYPWWQHRA